MLSRSAAQGATATNVVNGAARIKSVRTQQYVTAAPLLYLQIYNSFAPTVGTTKPRCVVPVPTRDTNDDTGRMKAVFPGGGSGKNGLKLETGFSYAVTTTPDGATGPTSGQEPVIEVDYESNNQ